MPESTDQDSATGRDRIANAVIMWSGVGIVVTTIVVMTATYGLGDKEKFERVATTVFNTLIPLFGTWVGTVLAFYFASKNFEAASKSTRELVGQLGDDRLKQIPVQEAWIPANAIAAITVEPGKEDEVAFTDIRKSLSSKVSRVPVWTGNKVVRLVIHESMVYKFLAEGVAGIKEVAGNLTASPVIKPRPSLQDFLDFEVGGGKKMKAVVEKIAWVAKTATLADAKAKMEGTPDSQDVFVTDTGSKDEPILGWVTNADIAKRMKT